MAYTVDQLMHPEKFYGAGSWSAAGEIWRKNAGQLQERGPQGWRTPFTAPWSNAQPSPGQSSGSGVATSSTPVAASPVAAATLAPSAAFVPYGTASLWDTYKVYVYLAIAGFVIWKYHRQILQFAHKALKSK